MGTEVRVWQITEDGKMTEVETTLAGEGRTEPRDLEKWISSNPAILGENIWIIGRQVHTKSGPLDLLAIDDSGNTVIVELKRDLLPRDVLAQAIDYASDVASWDLERLNRVCLEYRKQTLEEVLSVNADVDEDIAYNRAQRIIVVGTAMDSSLVRMIDWLKDGFGVTVNAVVFRYVRTKSGDELLARTMVVTEEEQQEYVRRRQGRTPFSDEPGDLPAEELEAKLREYIAEDRAVPRRVRKVLLPLCLRKDKASREEIQAELVRHAEASDDTAGFVLSTISREIGVASRAYLRQVIGYDKPEGSWVKDNYRIEPEYRELVARLLREAEAEDK